MPAAGRRAKPLWRIPCEAGAKRRRRFGAADSGSGRYLTLLEAAANHLLHAVLESELLDLEGFELDLVVGRALVTPSQLVHPPLVVLMLMVQAAELGVG